MYTHNIYKPQTLSELGMSPSATLILSALRGAGGGSSGAGGGG